MTTMIRHLNSSELPDVYAVLQELEQLKPGTEAIVRFDGRPLGILECVFDCYPGRFQFTPLERGPCDWRYQVAALDPSRRLTVSSYMQWDHDRLDDVLERAMGDLACENWRGALKHMGEFRDRLARHVEIEESILFPRFEEITGTRIDGPTDRMHAEHRDILQAVDTMLSGLHARDADDVDNCYVNLLATLVEHNMREEQMLYPLIDRALTRPELEGLMRSILLY